MGVVYHARHELTGREVALKLLRPELMEQVDAHTRFLCEVSAATRVGHPGVVQVHDAGLDEHGRFFLAMELLEGEDLGTCLKRRDQPLGVLLRIVSELLEPLAATHAVGLVHRDLKPENVFLTRRDGMLQVKLLDFGIARDQRNSSGTATGVVLGTPYYMSPEQALTPKNVGPASDVWAAGVMLYEILTGRLPFDGESPHAVVVQACSVAHEPVTTFVPGVAPAVAALVDACLAKEAARRPPDAAALKALLAPLLEAHYPRCSEEPPPRARNSARPALASGITLRQPSWNGQLPWEEGPSETLQRMEHALITAPRRSWRGALLVSGAALLVLVSWLAWPHPRVAAPRALAPSRANLAGQSASRTTRAPLAEHVHAELPAPREGPSASPSAASRPVFRRARRRAAPMTAVDLSVPPADVRLEPTEGEPPALFPSESVEVPTADRAPAPAPELPPAAPLLLRPFPASAVPPATRPLPAPAPPKAPVRPEFVTF